MKREKITPQEMADALDKGATVVTANNRLAGAIREQCEQRWLEEGRQAWITPEILPWSIWLQNSVADAIFSTALARDGFLLSTQQELCLWDRIITTHTEADGLIQQVPGMVRRAQEAWQLIHAWQIPLTTSVFGYNQDSQEFYQWASAFRDECVSNNWLSLPSVIDDLTRCIQSGQRILPAKKILLTGFDELTPQQLKLAETLDRSGSTIAWVNLSGQQSSGMRVQCIDIHQEAIRAACWIHQILEENPHSRIALIVPHLGELRETIIHALDTILVPRAMQPGEQHRPRPYNISLGLPLDSNPLIVIAWKLLALIRPVASLEDVSQLLRSPYIYGWEEEASRRAMLDARLRESGEQQISLKTLLYHAAKQSEYSCPLFVERLSSYISHCNELPAEGTPSQWLQRFSQLLSVSGWAQGRTLSSEEFQTLEAWHELLNQFATLETVTGILSAASALARLRSMAMDRIFQPELGDTPVQVMGILEAAGLAFDHVWIMGLNDRAWPSSPRTNPFIPLPLQRKLGLPHASSERELRVSQTITQRLLTSAREVIVSYSTRSGEEELRASSLIRHLPEIIWRDLNITHRETWRDRIWQSRKMSTLLDDNAPPLENTLSPGGSSVFRLQAQCPFHAFAEIRLGACALAKHETGLDAMTRGTLIHAVLEAVWRKLQTQQTLIDTDLIELQELVSICVEQVMHKYAIAYPHTLKGRFLVLEADRLTQQVLDWLEIEKKRTPFTVIENEASYEIDAGGVRVRVKIDRIDQLENGDRIIIDYKTGDVAPSKWFGERPEEPQLPLYSMAVDKDIAGLVFAQIKTGKMVFNGVLKNEGPIPDVKDFSTLNQSKEFYSWQGVLTHWRTTMNMLGQEIKCGRADVDPKPNACNWCELRSLCRIDEMARQSESVEEA